MCDDEWNVPVGEAAACGGDALFRRAAIAGVGGYNPDLIAGEEPDLCLRMRQQGWRVRRIDAEMTLHDAAMTHIRQWWRRSERSGHAFAEHVQRHGAKADPVWRQQVRSILAWGVALPLVAWRRAGAGLVAAAGLVALLYPLQSPVSRGGCSVGVAMIAVSRSAMRISWCWGSSPQPRGWSAITSSG